MGRRAVGVVKLKGCKLQYRVLANTFFEVGNLKILEFSMSGNCEHIIVVVSHFWIWLKFSPGQIWYQIHDSLQNSRPHLLHTGLPANNMISYTCVPWETVFRTLVSPYMYKNDALELYFVFGVRTFLPWIRSRGGSLHRQLLCVSLGICGFFWSLFC